MNVNQAISILYRAIEEKTEKEVSNALDNHPREQIRAYILRRMFAKEQNAQRALARALNTVTRYTEN